MNVMSFNIWSDAPRNSWWVKRRDGIASVLRRDELDVVGLQEATMPMMRDLHERLPQYEWVGAGRDDGDQQGECTPILFRADRFTARGHGHFWLAENCDCPGRGWDAMCSRIVTWAQLEERGSGRRVTHFNTHFDHFGRRARVQSAHLLLRKIEEIADGGSVVLTGDFNCRDTSAPYFVLTGRQPFGGERVSAEMLRDTRHDSAQPPEGPRRTYRGLLGLMGLGRIDYIFVKNGLQTRRHAVLDEAVGASDHRPVMAELGFEQRATSPEISPR
jgi:endonuclease/exonuclease/phosphatase family metal-dependent hydrolase